MFEKVKLWFKKVSWTFKRITLPKEYKITKEPKFEYVELERPQDKTFVDIANDMIDEYGMTPEEAQEYTRKILELKPSKRTPQDQIIISEYIET